MPVPTTIRYENNVWVAAGEGDLDRVKELVEKEHISPNAPDPQTYTPMHAAASYGHLNVLEYLVSKGGDVNVKDEDGETPLFTVESVEVARWLLEHGALTNCRNTEGNTPAQHLAEDFPAVSTYLHSIDPMAASLPSIVPARSSNYATEQTASQMMQSLVVGAEAIMQRAVAEGRDPDAELREMVETVVLGGIAAGTGSTQDAGMGDEVNEQGRRPGTYSEEQDSKRQKFDDAG